MPKTESISKINLLKFTLEQTSEVVVGGFVSRVKTLRMSVVDDAH